MGDAVVAEAPRVRGGRLGEQKVVEQVRAVDVEAEALGEVEQGAQLPVGPVAEEAEDLRCPRGRRHAVGVGPPGRAFLHEAGDERPGVGAGDRLPEVLDLVREEAEVGALQQVIGRCGQCGVEPVGDSLGAEPAVLRAGCLGVQAPARLDPREELPGGEAAFEDPPLSEHPAVDDRRHPLEGLAGAPADDARLVLARPALEGADEVAFEVVVPRGHLTGGRALRGLLHQPRDEQDVAQAGVQGGGAGEQRVREGVPDRADAQVVDRRLVAELVHCFHHPSALLGVDGEPGEGGGHGVHGAPSGPGRGRESSCWSLREIEELSGALARLMHARHSLEFGDGNRRTTWHRCARGSHPPWMTT